MHLTPFDMPHKTAEHLLRVIIQTHVWQSILKDIKPEKMQ